MNIKLRERFQQFTIQLAALPWLTWVLGSFFVVFFFYFIQPTFLNAYHELRLFPDFPELRPLGADLHEYLKFSLALRETGTPYIDPNYYPPFQSIFFFRLMRSTPERAYMVMSALSFACFLAITWLYPLLNPKKRRFSSLAGFALVTGLFSYGLWFEFERGQFDLIVMALCFAGIYLYHRLPHLRIAAYLLFVMSVQIKLYPIFFILCFATDWHDWKLNLRRWGLLLLANFAGLFVLGPKVFLDFIAALTGQVGRPTYWGSGNHSINSFITTLIDQTRSPEQLFLTLKANSLWMQLVLLVIFLAFFAVVLWITYRGRFSPGNPYLILLCTTAAMLIPSTSHDYKFCIFAAPMALLLNSLDQPQSGQASLNLAAAALLVVITTAYSTTLFQHNEMPLLQTSNLPALFIISAAAALLMAVRSWQAKMAQSGTEFHDLE